MGLYLGTSDLLSGGGASEGTTKEINGHNYSNVITNPKSNLFPVQLLTSQNIYNGGIRGDDQNWNTFQAGLLGGYTGPTNYSANTDEVIVNITNASNGGFVHWAKTPSCRFGDALITLKITLDGTTYTWNAKSYGSSQCVIAGPAHQDQNRMAGYNANYGQHRTTHPDVFPGNARAYFPSATVARHQSSLTKLYFENSCSISFNIGDVTTYNNHKESGAAITLL